MRSAARDRRYRTHLGALAWTRLGDLPQDEPEGLLVHLVASITVFLAESVPLDE